MTALYDRATLDRVPWPATRDGGYARRVLAPLVEHGPAAFIDNVHAEVRVLAADGHALPLVLSDPARAGADSYVVSPTNHYVDYGKREVELEMGGASVLRAVLPPLLEGFRPLFRWGGIDRVAYVNNWLLSTNLHPRLAPDVLRDIRDLVAATFPDRAVVFRSVNETLNAELMRDLRRLGFRPVFSRQVYLYDPRTPGAVPRSLRQDAGLARRGPYAWAGADDIGDDEVPRLRELYAQLYLEKYSPFNPGFTERFVASALRERWLEVFALRREGRTVATVGFVERGGTMTAPLIGYDRALPAEEGLYRRISYKLVEEARARGLLLNQSSGAAAFKRFRGGVPAMEMSLVYDRHLPARARLPWRVLETASRRAIVPLMRRMKL
ncbi:MAG TPA: GNAT family N-acetyltransferase [Longimicrobium sp.]|nr:GNAT family N-acetyltransferase [Longimicrobium sp.]